MATRKRMDGTVLEEIGKAAYGDRWQSPLAAALKVDQSTVSLIHRGKRRMTLQMRMKIASLAASMSQSLHKRADDLMSLTVEIVSNGVEPPATEGDK